LVEAVMWHLAYAGCMACNIEAMYNKHVKYLCGIILYMIGTIYDMIHQMKL
jgi:hypothetical protein